MSDVLFDGCHNVAELFLKKTAERADAIAMREKDFGIWQSFSWSEYRDYALKIANGLLACGADKGDVTTIQSEDCKEWMFADMGILLTAGTVSGIYPTYKGAQVQHGLVDSGSRFLFVEDEEQLDKYLELEEELPNIERVWVFDWKGLRGFEHDKVRPIEELYERGAAFADSNPQAVQERVAAIGNQDIAVLVYTSGTTGLPKGSMISHRYILFQMGLAPKYYPIDDEDEVLTYLPLCHVAERIFSTWLGLAHGPIVNFAESPETVMQNLQELSPTFMLAVPRVWEKFYSRVSTAMAEATWIGRQAYALAFAVGRRRADTLIAAATPSFVDGLLCVVADRLVFRNLKKLLGLDRIHAAVSGAAPVSPQLLRWFLAMGLRVDEAYGQTETGLLTTTTVGGPAIGTIGRAHDEVELRFSAEGEILARSPGQFTGYLNNAEKTAETIVEGWVHTGDVGEIDENGNIRITDRLKDIIITAGGKNITPSVIENDLKFSPYISDAVVIGDQRKYLTCLIMIDQENVEHFAQMNAVPFTDYKSLCAREEIIGLIDAVVQKANTGLSSVESIKKFRLIDVLLTAEDDELTPTMKLKRSFVSKKYTTLIDSMYDD